MSKKPLPLVWLLGLAASVLCCSIGFIYINLQNSLSDAFLSPSSKLLIAAGTKKMLLDSIKIGTSEKLFQDSSVFQRDQNSRLRDGEHQYSSRKADKEEGNFTVRCFKDKCFSIDIVYMYPIDSARALARLNQLLPEFSDQIPTAPTQRDKLLNNAVVTTYNMTPDLAGFLYSPNDDTTRVSQISVALKKVKEELE